MKISRTKPCRYCGRSLPLEAFSLQPRMKDGRLNKCKECAVAYTRQHRIDKPEYYRTYEQSRADDQERAEARKAYAATEEGLAARKRARATQALMNAKRVFARYAVRSALLKGVLTRFPCWVCGKVEVEAHHPDYDSPLDVVWLCRKHHRETHALTKEA